MCRMVERLDGQEERAVQAPLDGTDHACFVERTGTLYGTFGYGFEAAPSAATLTLESRA
jgi:hypothetical protein